MSIYHFNILSEYDNYDSIFTKGQFVDTLIEGETKNSLYSLSYFWVEVEYHVSTSKITGICSFVSGEKLNRYCNIPNSY